MFTKITSQNRKKFNFSRNYHIRFYSNMYIHSFYSNFDLCIYIRFVHVQRDYSVCSSLGIAAAIIGTTLTPVTSCCSRFQAKCSSIPFSVSGSCRSISVDMIGFDATPCIMSSLWILDRQIDTCTYYITRVTMLWPWGTSPSNCIDSSPEP